MYIQRLSQAWPSGLVEHGSSASAGIIVVNRVSLLSGSTQNERDRAQKGESGKECEAHGMLGKVGARKRDMHRKAVGRKRNSSLPSSPKILGYIPSLGMKAK